MKARAGVSIMRALNKRLLSDARASQVAEAALVLPIVFMLLLGIYWFGRAFNTYATIIHAAREGARTAVAQTCASCGTPNGAPAAAAVTTAVTQALRASSVDTSQILVYSPASPVFCNGLPAATNCNVPSTNNNIAVCNNVQLTPVASPGPPACGVTVSFQYPYQFWFPFTSLNKQQIILTADVQMKGEY